MNAPSIQNSCSGQTYLLSFDSGTNVDHSSLGSFGSRMSGKILHLDEDLGDWIGEKGKMSQWRWYITCFSQSYAQHFIRGGLG